MKKEKICPVCDLHFISNTSNQKYCSPECRINATRMYHRDRMRTFRAKQAEHKRNEEMQGNAERRALFDVQLKQNQEIAKADRERRAASGDIFAQMEIALYYEHDGEKYFELRFLWEESERQRIAEMFRDSQ